MELTHECLAHHLHPPLLRALCMTIKDVFVSISPPSGGIVVKIHIWQTSFTMAVLKFELTRQ